MSERSVPILPSRDLDETLAFDALLGFEKRGAPAEQWGHVIVGRGSLELHFYSEPDVDPLTTSASCYCFVDDAQALYDEWVDLVVPDAPTGSRVVAPEDRDYGLREFAVVDRSGNLVRVGSPL
jgi:hypothetical protein